MIWSEIAVIHPLSMGVEKTILAGGDIMQFPLTCKFCHKFRALDGNVKELSVSHYPKLHSMWSSDAQIHRIGEWLQLERTLNIIELQPPCHGQRFYPPNQAAQGPIISQRYSSVELKVNEQLLVTYTCSHTLLIFSLLQCQTQFFHRCSLFKVFILKMVKSLLKCIHMNLWSVVISLQHIQMILGWTFHPQHNFGYHYRVLNLYYKCVCYANYFSLHMLIVAFLWSLTKVCKFEKFH